MLAFEHVSNVGAPNTVAKLEQRPLEFAIAPPGILSGQARNQRFEFLRDTRPAYRWSGSNVHFRRTSSQCHCGTVSGVNRRRLWLSRARKFVALWAGLAASMVSGIFSHTERRAGWVRFRCKMRNCWRNSRISKFFSWSDQASEGSQGVWKKRCAAIKPMPGRPPKQRAALEAALPAQLAAPDDATAEQHSQLWAAAHGGETARAAWHDLMGYLPANDLVFVDECGSNIALTPLYARAPRGQRAYGAVPRN